MKINLEEEVVSYLKKKNDTSVICELIKRSEKNRLLDEIDEIKSEVERLKLEIRIHKDREKKIIKVIIEILDSIEWTLRVLNTLTNRSLNTTIENTWKKIRNKLMIIGLTQIYEKGCTFNDEIHKCIDVIDDDRKDNDEVSEIVKIGYIYKGEIIRTADVIVVNNN